MNVLDNFSIIVDFDDGNLALWSGIESVGAFSGLLEIDMGAVDVVDGDFPLHAIEVATSTFTDADSLSATIDAPDLLFGDALLGQGGLKQLPFVLDFETAADFSGVPKTLRIDCQANDGAGDNVINPLRVRLLDIVLHAAGSVPGSSPADPTPADEIADAEFIAKFTSATITEPWATALHDEDDAQRLADTIVQSIAETGRAYKVPVIVPMGSLGDFEPLNVFFVKHNSPGLREGKNLILKDVDIRHADPSVPVICEFRGPR